MTPHKSESRLAGRLIANSNTPNVVDFHAVSDSGKAVATLKARFAIAGHQVHEGSNDDLIVTRWNMSRYCADLASLRTFARVLEVNP